MRTVSPEALSYLGLESAQALMCEMNLTANLYVTTAAIDIDYSGHTYIGGRGVSVEEVKDQGGEMQKLQFSLSGVPSEYLALALEEQIQGKAVKLSFAIMAPDDQRILDVNPIWAGTLDQMPIRHNSGACVIGVTAEHRGVTYARPKAARYTDAEQQRLHPGDRCLEFLVSQSTHQDIWPAAAYFKQ